MHDFVSYLFYLLQRGMRFAVPAALVCASPVVSAFVFVSSFLHAHSSDTSRTRIAITTAIDLFMDFPPQNSYSPAPTVCFLPSGRIISAWQFDGTDILYLYPPSVLSQRTNIFPYTLS
jgi:hypothetical protein